MTALAVEERVARSHERRSEDRLFEPSEVTLEDTVLGVWEALEAHGRAECPVCSARLIRPGCTSCGSLLG